MAWDEKIKKKLNYCGEQVFIGENVIFTNPSAIVLEDRVRIDPFTLITTNLIIGSNSHICSHAVLGGGLKQRIVLAGWNFIGYGSKLFTASEDYSGEFGPVCEYWGSNYIDRGDITFEAYSGIASDVMIFPGVTLPEGCAVGAKSLVHTSAYLQSWSIFLGNPVKYWKNRDRKTIKEKSNDPDFLKER